MGSGKKLTPEEISKIRILKEEGYSNRQIAKRIDRSASVINKFFKDPENYGKKQKGRTKRATTAVERRRILRIASNSSQTARQIREQVGTSASIRTVQRILKTSPVLERLRLKKKPALTERHKETRLNFARAHMTWNDEWKRVIFTDEKRFTLDGPDGYAYYFHGIRKEKRFLSRHHRREGGLMIWGAISSYGTVHIAYISGRQTANDYVAILRNAKSRIIEKMEGQEWIFQHDHAAIHTAAVVRRWFEQENVRVLDWPSISPDLNIIENVWGWLTRKVYESGTQFNTLEELQEAITTAWTEIPVNILRNLYDSIPNRIFEVIRKNGGNTKY